MTVAPVFQAIISATNNASSAIMDVMRAFTGMGDAADKAGDKTRQAARQASASVTKLGRDAQAANRGVAAMGNGRSFITMAQRVTLLRGNFGELTTTIGHTRNSLAQFIPVLGALGAASSLVGLFNLSKDLTDTRGPLASMSQQLGVTVNSLNNLHLVAKMADISTEEMDSSLNKLNKTIATTVAGKNKEAGALFKHLGISLKDAHGNMATVTDLLPKLADAIAKTNDPAMRTRMTMELFGKAGAGLIPMLMNGKDAMTAAMEEAKKLNYQFGPDEEQIVNDYGDSLDKLTAAGHGLTDEIGAKLAPVLKPLVDTMTAWIVANRDWIATGIAGKVKELSVWLRTIDWPALGARIKNWAKIIGGAANAAGGLTTVIGALALVFASPLVMSVGQAVASIVRLGAVLLGLPFGPVIAAAAAVGLVAYKIWQNWDTVSGWLKIAWDGLKAKAGEIMEAFKPLTDFFVKLWDAIVAAFDRIMAPLRAQIAEIKGLIDSVASIWSFTPGTPPAAPGAPPAPPSRGLTRGYGPTPRPPSISLPTLEYSKAGGGAERTLSDGIKVHIDMSGVPTGARVTARTKGGADVLGDVGYSYPSGFATAH